MIHPLVRKELREHLWVLVGLWLLTLLGVAVLITSARESGSPLVAYRLLVTTFGVLLSLALANRLVVREYGGRTQLFLETLPLGRGEVVAVKWLFGVTCLLVPMALGFALTLLAARNEVVLTRDFVLLLAARGGTFLVFIYSVAFVVALTGRYRYVLWLGLLLLLFIADSIGQLPIERWAPFQLVSASMPFQREPVPAWWFWSTWAAIAGLVGVAFLLTMGSRGSWVVALSRRMTLREKAGVTASFLCCMYVAMQVEERKQKPPFELLDAVVSGSGAAGGMPKISVARVEEVDEAYSLALARQLSTDLRQTSDYLSLSALPAVAVLPDVAIDPDLFLLADLPGSDGVVVRGALGQERFDEPDFRAFVVARVLDWHSRGRTLREDRRWLVDGFAQRQVAAGDQARMDLLQRRAAMASALLDADEGSLARAFSSWLSTREKLGECLGDALAWRATEQLAQSLGDVRFRELARTQLGTRSHSTVRAYLADQPVDELLHGEQPPAMREVMAQLQAALLSERQLLEGTIGNVKEWVVALEARPMRGTTYELHYAIEASGAAVPPPVYAIRYARIGPWQAEVPRASLERVDATAGGVLPTSFPRGERVLTVVEVPLPELACAVRVDARRWVVQ